MKIKVSEAEGIALDWMVAKAEGLTPTLHKNPYGYWVLPNLPGSYSTDWSKGGPIIEREKISTCWEGATWVATLFNKNCDETWYGHQYGPTPLIAAMRCWVTYRMGEEVDVPDELL